MIWGAYIKLYIKLKLYKAKMVGRITFRQIWITFGQKIDLTGRKNCGILTGQANFRPLGGTHD